MSHLDIKIQITESMADLDKLIAEWPILKVEKDALSDKLVDLIKAVEEVKGE